MGHVSKLNLQDLSLKSSFNFSVASLMHNHRFNVVVSLPFLYCLSPPPLSKDFYHYHVRGNVTSIHLLVQSLLIFLGETSCI